MKIFIVNILGDLSFILSDPELLKEKSMDKIHLFSKNKLLFL